MVRFSKLLALFILVFVFQSCTSAGRTGERISIAVADQPLSAPVYVAYEKGFFARQGLHVALERYWVGKDALGAVLSGKAQIATVAETPVMFGVLKDEPLSVLATIGDSNKYMKIIARKDRGIKHPQDLRGKKIAVSTGTNAMYFLDSYLTFNGISKDQVRIVPVKAEKMTDALASGTVDAAVTWKPFFDRQLKVLGANAMTFENDIIYRIYWNAVSDQAYVKSFPRTVEKFLRALLDAQSYIEEYPEECRRITEHYVAENDTLKDFNFDIRLPQSLILELEDQARWAIRARLSDRPAIPDFLHTMYVQGLAEVDPESVTVIHN